jgi:uncharacterized membrane protein YkoI
MNTRKIIPAVMAAALAVGAVTAPVFAVERSQRDEHESAREIAAVRAAKVTSAAAIAAAEKTTGGRAVKVAMEDENGTHLYEVRVIAGEPMLTLKIDPASGEVRATERSLAAPGHAALAARSCDRGPPPAAWRAPAA